METEQLGFGWMGMLDKARPWVGSRVTHQPAPQTYFVSHVPYELTESIDEFKLKDDVYGIYYPLVQMMGTNMRKVPDYEIRDLLKNQGKWTGAYQNGLDGLSFFNTAHPVDFYDAAKGTYVNDFRSGGQTINGILTGGALAPNAYATLWQEFASRRSETNEALGVIPKLTVVPPQLNITAMTILHAQFYAPGSLGNLTSQVGSTENMLKGSTDLLMVPEFAADPTNWYMFDTTRAVKPISWCLRSAADFTYRINPQDPVVFDTHTYTMGSKMQFVPAWSHAWLAAVSGP